MKRLLLALPFTLIASLTSCDRKDREQEQVTVIRPIYAMRVDSSEQHGVRKFSGQAEASNAVTLAFEVSGKLQEVTLAVGDQIQKGDILASLDPRDFRNALDQSKAELTRSKALYERMQRAAKDNAISRQELTNAKAAYDSAVAAVKTHQKALDDTEIRAPYDAIVVAKHIDSFGNIIAKQPAVRLVDPGLIEMVVDIPEDIISLARVGDEILVEFDAFPGEIITSTINEIGTEASRATRTYPVTLIMDQPETHTILPGMAGKAWPPLSNVLEDVPEHMRGFEIPLNAILSTPEGKTFVWVIAKDDGRVKRLPVTTGELTRDGVLVQGLQGGEMIATAGVNLLKEDQQIRIIQP